MALNRALITGVAGQDGSYLAELLLGKGYEVHGVLRSAGSPSDKRLRCLIGADKLPQFVIHEGNVRDAERMVQIVREVEPDEIYHLAAQSDVKASFKDPLQTLEATGRGCLVMLEAARRLLDRKPVKFVHAASSAMYGGATSDEGKQSEKTPFRPRSPYACAKAYAFHQTVNHREAFGLFACNGILFNHESPRRGEQFVSRKITRAVGRIAAGLQDKLLLGDLTAERDWGFAGDYVDALWLMLQQEEPSDYVVATGVTHTVQEFLERAFAAAGVEVEGRVEMDPRFLRPSETPYLCGDASKARRELGWAPRIGFEELVEMMAAADVELARQERAGEARST